MYSLVLAFKWPADTHGVATEFCNMALLTKHFPWNQRIKTERNYLLTVNNHHKLAKWHREATFKPHYTTTQTTGITTSKQFYILSSTSSISPKMEPNICFIFLLCVQLKIISKNSEHTQSEEISFTSASLGRFRNEFVLTHSIAFSPT